MANLAKGVTKECVGWVQMNVQNVFVLPNLIGISM
jgi:hypothetical protein